MLLSEQAFMMPHRYSDLPVPELRKQLRDELATLERLRMWLKGEVPLGHHGTRIDGQMLDGLPMREVHEMIRRGVIRAKQLEARLAAAKRSDTRR